MDCIISFMKKARFLLEIMTLKGSSSPGSKTEDFVCSSEF